MVLYMIQQRKYNIDFLRILACFMVVFLHVSASGWYTAPVSSFEWKTFNFYDTAVRSAVPLFLMISGMLFLSKDTLSVKKLLLKNTTKLVLIYFLWSVFYAIDTLSIQNIIHNFNLKLFISTVLTSKYHLWYLPALISIYFILPILRTVKDIKNGKYLNYILLFFFLFDILLNSISLLSFSQGISTLLNKFDFALGSYCGYFILGYVISKNSSLIKIRSRYLLVLLVFVVSITAIGNYLISANKGTASAILYDSFFISTFIEACIIFIIFQRISTKKISHKLGNRLVKVSRYTLFVYLFHPFVLEHLDRYLGLNTFSMNALISVPIISIIVFLICVLFAFLLDLIPVLNKILL